MSLQATSVSVQVGSATLLEDVSVEVTAGRIVAAAGPNGAGKSTLLSVLAGDRAPDAGSVTLEGRPLGRWTRSELALRRAVMSTDRDVAFDFSAREVALLGRLPLHGGAPDAADRAIVEELLESVDATDLASRVHATLSTGERQRVSLARAVAQISDPAGREREGARYLLLDEPTSSLDPAHQLAAMDLLRRTAAAGNGVLMVVHDLHLAAAHADHLLLLRAGRVVAAGRPADVLRADLLAAAFGVPMRVITHPGLGYPLVVADPRAGASAPPMADGV
jgi:iron complex transport system ATP-binding protein